MKYQKQIREIIERGSYTGRSSNQVAILERFGDEVAEMVSKRLRETESWLLVYEAAKKAIEQCKQASGMHSSIDKFVNAVQIAHAVCGTDINQTDPINSKVNDGKSN